MQAHTGTWRQINTIESRRYTCGNCSADITSNVGYSCLKPSGAPTAFLYICHSCNRPTLISKISNDEQVPAPMLGETIDHLPKDIEDLYAEMRRSTAANAYTSVVLAGRKLLMHIAVEAGANEGKKFVAYVDYLVDNHYTPPNSKVWVDKIRELGNDANHEIIIMGQTEAKDIMKFTEMILKFKYEFPESVTADSEELPEKV
ncbi:MAG: DUF4145 domain-containing protein [Candidatus Saccharibacteria bacterium]|nr:DUF4145 domain-containing protein [Candidatus Saccharibacteria bacterium]